MNDKVQSIEVDDIINQSKKLQKKYVYFYRGGKK